MAEVIGFKGQVVPIGDIADPKTVAIFEDALARAKRGEILSFSIIGIGSDLCPLVFTHAQTRVHQRLLISGLATEQVDLANGLNATARPIDIGEPEPSA